MIAQPTTGKAYCNCLAMELGLNPVGHAGDFEDAVVIETPLPWKLNMMQEAGALPQPIIDLFGLWLQRYYAGEGYPHRPLAVAPDPEYSQHGFRRVMFYTRPAAAFAAFDKVEYCVPEDEVGPLVWALYEDRVSLPRFERYRTPAADSIREILVCTHGTVDAACAKFGYPLYRHMRQTCASETLRVWRVSHFGGHVFAPTLMDMPTGHYWAYIDKAQAEQLIHRSGDVSALHGFYRGWAGLEGGFLQTAECALWQRYGWEWFDFRKSGRVLAQDPNTEQPLWAEVEITFTSADQRVQGQYRARVDVERHIETIITTGQEHTYNYPQYVVTPAE